MISQWAPIQHHARWHSRWDRLAGLEPVHESPRIAIEGLKRKMTETADLGR